MLASVQGGVLLTSEEQYVILFFLFLFFLRSGLYSVHRAGC